MENVNSYLNHLELEGKSNNTIETYGFHLKKFHEWFLTTNLELDEIGSKDLLEFKEMLAGEGKTPRTINALLSCTRGYYDYLILKEKVSSNPVSNKLSIQVSTKKIQPLTDIQLSQLTSHISEWKENIRAAFHLMLATGARVGEVANLQKGDFSVIDGQLWINIENTKWGSDRKIPLILKNSATIVYKYIENLDIYNAPAFRVSKRTLQTYANKFQKETGIPFHCHIIRHTFATRLLESGIDIEKIRYLLGHKNNNMTRHYTQTANISVKELAPTIWQKGDD